MTCTKANSVTRSSLRQSGCGPWNGFLFAGQKRGAAPGLALRGRRIDVTFGVIAMGVESDYQVMASARRVIATRQTKEIGRCIYCGSTDGKLSEEHVTPFGLSGLLVLLNASCERHSTVTSALEDRILRGMFFASRAALGTRTRRKKLRARPHPMTVEKNGQRNTVYKVWQDHWKVIQLPIFPLPAHIDGRVYSGGICYTSMDIFELGERQEDIARRLGVDKVFAPEFKAEDFARFIAKMAYGYAVERYGLDAFEEVYPLAAMLGESDDIGRWVGCSDRRELPVRQCIVSVGFKIIPGDDLVVKVKMFPRFDGAEYVVVIGKVKEIYRNYFHSIGEKG